MTNYQITIKRDDCIQCGNCYHLDPDHFEHDENYTSKVVNGETTEETSSGYFYDDKITLARQAEEECPVNIITVREI